MAKHSPGRGARAWQVKSVWVKRREGPERILSAYRLLLDLPPRRTLRAASPLGLGHLPRQESRPAAGEEIAEAGLSTSPEGRSL
jgi:hypothetical protein